MALRPLALARSIADTLEEADADVRLDPRGSLVTRSGSERVGGIEVRPGVGPPARVAVGMEVVGAPEISIPEAAAKARKVVRAECKKSGVRVERVDVTFTDIDDGAGLLDPEE